MNIVIASDIHGSASHCLKFVKACYLEQAETVLLLGDILDGNKEVAEMLNTLNKEKSILCVRGNCDYPEDQAMLDFPIMAEYCLLFAHDRLIFAAHGHRSIPQTVSRQYPVSRTHPRSSLGVWCSLSRFGLKAEKEQPEQLHGFE